MQKNTTFQFEKLKVYQKAIDIVDRVYELTNTFPKEELYGLTSQFRRATVTIGLNIAEGAARSKRNFRRFLDITHGSIFECVALLTICKRRKYIQETVTEELREAFSELSKMTSGLKRGIGFSDRRET